MNWFIGFGVVVAIAWTWIAYIIGSVIERNDRYHFWTGMAFWCLWPVLYLLWFVIHVVEVWI